MTGKSKRIKRKHAKQGILSLRIGLLFIVALLFVGCDNSPTRVINIGYIGPLSTRATDLGVGPANAMKLAIEQYNESRKRSEPLVNLFIEDDQWEKDKALPAYLKLRKENNIDILFISNTDGTIAVQDQILEDGVIAVNPLNSDAMLSTMNHNTFKVAKTTEEANSLIAIRIIELGFKKVLIMHYPNDFMTRGAMAAKTLLEKAEIENTLISSKIDKTDFSDELRTFKEGNYDALVLFGYKEFGFAMKQARDMGIEAPFFGSTVLLDPAFYDNSEGAIIGTECSFFTPEDGDYIRANQFIADYQAAYGETPYSVWPPMQAYDAMNLVLDRVRNVNTISEQTAFDDWLRDQLYNVRYFNGVCGNLSISADGSSKGIYFSLYRYEEKGRLAKVQY